MDKPALLRLIARAADEGRTSLELSNRGLTELPPEIGGRIHLTHSPEKEYLSLKAILQTQKENMIW